MSDVYSHIGRHLNDSSPNKRPLIKMIYVWICVCKNVYVHICMYACMHVCILHVCMYVSMHPCIHKLTHAYIQAHICVCLCVYACITVFVYLCTCILVCVYHNTSVPRHCQYYYIHAYKHTYAHIV